MTLILASTLTKREKRIHRIIISNCRTVNLWFWGSFSSFAFLLLLETEKKWSAVKKNLELKKMIMSLVTLIFIFMELRDDFLEKNSWYGVGLKCDAEKLIYGGVIFMRQKREWSKKLLCHHSCGNVILKGFRATVKRLGKVNDGGREKRLRNFYHSFPLKNFFASCSVEHYPNPRFFRLLRQKCDTIDLLKVLWSRWNFFPFVSLFYDRNDDERQLQ